MELRAVRCRETTCNAEIVFLPNPDSGKKVPVDWESLDPDDGEGTEYDKTRHVSHFKTCKAPGRFSAGTRRP